MGELVVGVDGSDGSRAALSWAVAEAELSGADLTVATVAHPPALLSGQADMGEQLGERLAQDVARRAHLLLEDLVAPHMDSGVAIRPVVLRDGAPFQALIGRAAGTDGLVVGSRGFGTFGRLLLGSVSQQIAVHAKSTVVVVPQLTGDRPRNDTVVAGSDCSDGSRVALRRAAVEASLRGCELEVVMVLPPPAAAGERSPAQVAVDAFLWRGVLSLADLDLTVDWEQQREQIMTQWRAAAERQLRAELAHVERSALPKKVTTTVIGARHVARALLDAAEEARLLVVGRRGRGGFAGMVLGSVSQQCVRYATSPVMVVPDETAHSNETP